eukprot:sb/3472202/
MKSTPNVTWSTGAIADLDGTSGYSVVNSAVTDGYTMTSVLTVDEAELDTTFTCEVESSDWGSDSPKSANPEMDVFVQFIFSLQSRIPSNNPISANSPSYYYPEIEIETIEVLSGSNATLTCEVTGIADEPSNIVWIVAGNEYDEETVSEQYTVSFRGSFHLWARIYRVPF